MAGRKPRVFIACSSEHLALGRAVQSNLDHDFQTKVWDQGTFGLSEHPLVSLLEELKKTDYGVFILAPDDIVESRGEPFVAPRDNVLFELGLMAGHMGSRHSFFIVPRGVKKLKLPSDLLGLTPATYDSESAKADTRAALGHACNEIRDAITRQSVRSSSSGLLRVAPFNTLTSLFSEILPRAIQVTTYFIHSRRWRENHHDAIVACLSNSAARMRVFLPDLRKKRLADELCEHFEDGTNVMAFVADAYSYYARLDAKFPRQVDVRLYERYPTYSWYSCDDHLIIALYPNATLKHPVPTLVCTADGSIGEFWQLDMGKVLGESTAADGAELDLLAQQFMGGSARDRPSS